jgi:hypothetical protein
MGTPLSSARITFPKTKLRQLMRAPPELPAAQRKQQIATAADAAVQACEQQLISLIVQIEQKAKIIDDGGHADAVGDLYGLSAGAVGAGAVLGRGGVDEAFLNLCSLLSRCRAEGRYDHEGVAAHLRALRVLASGRELTDAEISEQLANLKGSTH